MSLTRSSDDRIIFGVCGGLSESLRVPPLAMRIAFVLLGLTWGLGIIAYILLALLMDDDAVDDDDRELEDRMAENGREALSRVRELGREVGDGARDLFSRDGDDDPRPRQRRAGAVLLIVGALIVLWSLGLLGWVTFPILVGGAALGFGAWLLFGNKGGPSRP
jgi:phage shock protein PspC (stress-responsive transcriptional regulator)